MHAIIDNNKKMEEKMLIDSKKLDLYLKLNYNVLFAGRPGVGKTSIIYDAAKKAGLKIKYFSAPTMDPWVDLVGVPKNVMVNDLNGNQVEVLDLIPPKDFIVNKYDIIFIDEFNRAPPKVTNALMELMQFKTINGRPLDIKMVWGAINPFTEEGDFHVEKLDPAVEDRFHIKIDLPYKIDNDYIKKKHGSIGETFVEWWNNQPADIQYKVSPRRVDDAISFYNAGGTISDMIKHGNIPELISKIKIISEVLNFENALINNNENVLKKIFSKNLSKSIEKAIKEKDVFAKVVPFLSEEWLSSQILDSKKDPFVFNQVNSLAQNGDKKCSSILNEICKTNINSSFVLSNFSKIKDSISKETVENIQKNTLKNALTSKSIKENERLLAKCSEDGKLLQLFIPKSSESSFTASSLNNFYTNTAFSNIFKNYYSITSAKDNLVSIEESQECFKEKLAFSIAISCLITKSLGSKGVVYDKVTTALRDVSSSSYFFGKKNANKDFVDMEERISNFEITIEKMLPNGLNIHDLIKVYNYGTKTSVRSNLDTPFSEIDKHSKRKKYDNINYK